MKIETKALKFTIKELSEDGSFTGYAAAFGNVDSDGEVIRKGAFAKTIRERADRIKILWQHDRTKLIGRNQEASEDDYGLLVKGKLTLGVQQAREAYELLKDGALDAMSIGIQVIQDAIESGARVIKEVRLLEYSLVTFPANEAAVVTAVKQRKEKAMDFNSMLSEMEAMRDMQEERWKMESALYQALDVISEDEEMSLDDKKAAAKTSLTQYAEKMGEWWARHLDMMAEQEGEKGEKAGRTISAATEARLKEAVETHEAAIAMHRQAMKLSKKGIAAMRQMTYAGITAGGDKTPPQPMGGKSKAGEPATDHSLIEAARKTRQALRVQ